MHYFLSMQKVALQTKNVDYFNIGVYRDWLTTAAVFEWLFEELQFLKMFTLNTQIQKQKLAACFPQVIGLSKIRNGINQLNKITHLWSFKRSANIHFTFI